MTMALVQQRAAEAAVEAEELHVLAPQVVIDNPQTYAEVGTMLKDVARRIKFLDEERKVSVKPLNDEVKRVNDWFRPALDKLSAIRVFFERGLANYDLAQASEKRRLMLEASEAAQKALATVEAPMAESRGLMERAAAATPAKTAGVSGREVWTFTVEDPAALERRFLAPDHAAIAAWVKEHGDKDVPKGVKVVADVRYTVRSK